MASNSFSIRPIYLQLHDALAERIAKGSWKPGQAIPNETDLAHEFGVSPGTMRKALSVMESERLITRKQGRGTFVNDPAAEGLVDRYCNIRGADSSPIASRLEGKTKIVETVASEAECGRLQLGSQDRVWRVQRVRLTQEQAFMWEEICLPVSLFPGLSAENFDRIVILAPRYGLLLGQASERISIGAACRLGAEALGIAEGAPVLVLDRVVHTIDARPVEWRLGQCHLASNYYLAHIN